MKLTAESTVINDDKLNTNIDNAQSTANSAKSVADNTAQYFWFTSSGTDTGAHISEKTQTQFISSPSGGNLLARSNGVAVRDGLTELATFGSNMRIGKQNGSCVLVTPTAIQMTDGTRTVYEVANKTSDTITVKRIYNMTLDATRMIGFDDYIALGRTVSSWISNGIKLTYKRNGGASQTATFSSMPVASSTYGVWCTLNGTTVEATFQASDTTTGTDTYTIVSIEFNFKTTQQVVESTLGAYADSTMSGALKVGKGTGDSAKANAMLLDWGGTAMFGGDVVAYCNSDSSGGMSLTREIYENAYYYSSGSSTWFEIASYIVGRMVTLVINATKSTSTASGSDLFNVDLTSAHIPKPVWGVASGMTYYGAHAIGLLIDSNSHFVVRNASNSAVTASDTLQGSLTYICQTNPETNSIIYYNS